MLVGWAGTLGVGGWTAVAGWIALLAWLLLCLERSEFARGFPLGNALRHNGYTGSDVPPGALAGRVAVVTGASSGLGLEVALTLGVRGATVVLACRDLNKAATAADELRAAGVVDANIDVVELNLADMSSVQAAGETILQRHPVVHILVNNAGLSTVYPPTLTQNDLEITFQVNYLGHFHLSRLMLPALLESRSRFWAPRIVFLTSSLHRAAPPGGVWLTRQQHNNFTKFSITERYAVAKLACLAIAVEMDRRYGNQGIFINAVHPGVVATAILRDPLGVATALVGSSAAPYVAPLISWGKRLRDALLAYSPKQAALTVLYAAASPQVPSGGYRGHYIVPEGVPWPMNHPSLNDSKALTRLWEFSHHLVTEMTRSAK